MMIRAAGCFAAVGLLLATPGFAGQLSFESTTGELASPDPALRLRAVRLLRDSGYAEAAEPIASLVLDADDGVQFEAIATELELFLRDKVVPRRRVGYVIEVRNKATADSAFARGPQALAGRRVPTAVLTALRSAIRDDNPAVAIEALYAFGTLAGDAPARSRRDLLRASAPDLAPLVAASTPALRLGAVRVIGRVFERRHQDDPVDATVGDALIVAINDRDRAVRQAALSAIGALRYERGLEAATTLFAYYGRGDEAAAAIDAVARIAHPSSAALLASLLEAKDAATRAAACEGIGRLGDRTRLADIQAALGGDRVDSVQLAVQFAAARLSGAPIEQLVEALGRPKLRDRAFAYLVELAPGQSAAFARFLQDPEGRVRADVADALGLAGDRTALPLLDSLQRDPDPQVVQAAARAVARLQP